MAVVAQVPSNVYAAGPRSFGPAPMALGVIEIKATFTRENWPLTNVDPVLTVSVEASLDGGATFPFSAATTWRGGIVVNSRTGVPNASESISLRGIPEPDNPNRMIRASVDVLSQLRTAVTLETF